MPNTAGVPAMMSIEQRSIEPGITVLHVQGKITAGHHARELAIKIDELVQSGARHVVFDVTDTTYIDSTGLGMIVMFGGKLKRNAGALRIVGATGLVANTLTLCKVPEIIPCYPTLEQATASFGLAAGAA